MSNNGIGRPFHSLWDELGFTPKPIFDEKKKTNINWAICWQCGLELHNSSSTRLKMHRNKCTLLLSNMQNRQDESNKRKNRSSEISVTDTSVDDDSALSSTFSKSSHQEEASEEKSISTKKSLKNLFNSSQSPKLSINGDRIEFQIQGHEGPKTYIFGYDTGDGKNRQFRLEERMKDGIVKGHYGYYDATGKLRTIKYLAHPFYGYQEMHHESNNISLKTRK